MVAAPADATVRDRKSTLDAFKVGVTENLGGPGYFFDERELERSQA